VALLRTAQRAGNLDWALKEMAEANRRRLAYRLQVVGQLTFPPVIVAFGLLVAVVGAAVLSDLATLIWRLV